MADISHIFVKNTTFDIKDHRIPNLSNSENTYLRGDGTWAVPATTVSSGVTFIDGGDHLIVYVVS